MEENEKQEAAQVAVPAEAAPEQIEGEADANTRGAAEEGQGEATAPEVAA